MCVCLFFIFSYFQYHTNQIYVSFDVFYILFALQRIFLYTGAVKYLFCWPRISSMATCAEHDKAFVFSSALLLSVERKMFLRFLLLFSFCHKETIQRKVISSSTFSCYFHSKDLTIVLSLF